MATAPRLDVLARRVRWLDRYRRVLSIVLAIVVWLVASREVAAFFQTQWLFIGVVTAVFATLAWWIIEMCFAWLIAMWETEHDRISRDRGLPRAELIVRRKK